MSDKFTKYISERGRKSELARALKITKGAVGQWSKVPLERVPDVERITGIPRHELRPDFFKDLP